MKKLYFLGLILSASLILSGCKTDKKEMDVVEKTVEKPKFEVVEYEISYPKDSITNHYKEYYNEFEAVIKREYLKEQQPHVSFIYNYHNQSNTDFESIYVINANGDTTNQSFFKLENDSLLTVRENYHDNQLSLVYHINKDKNGQIIKQEAYLPEGNLIESITFKYNADGLVIEEKNLLDQTYILFDYNSKGDLKEKKYFTMENEMLYDQVTYIYKTNEHGDWIEKTEKDQSDETISITSRLIKYLPSQK